MSPSRHNAANKTPHVNWYALRNATVHILLPELPSEKAVHAVPDDT